MSEIRRFPRRFDLQPFTTEQLDAIHEASMRILEETGFSTSSRALAETMAEGGQRVEVDGPNGNARVWLDPAFVMGALALAPRRYTLGARDPNDDLPLDGRHMYMSTDGCPAHIIDIETGERRATRKQDLGDLARVADALPQYGIVYTSVAANDVPVPVRAIHETHAMWANTSKHVMQVTAANGFSARGIVDMMEVIQGSTEAIRRRPILSSHQCVISPLHWDGDVVDAMEVFGLAGVPVGVTTMPLAAATAPASLAGTIALANAEVLSGIAILETLVPGAPANYVSFAATIDLRTGQMNPTFNGEDTWLEMSSPAMARYYGIPGVHSTMGTGSLAHDWQAGVQNAQSAMGSMVTPGDIMIGGGSLAAANVFSFAGLVLDAEIMESVYRWMEGIDVSDDALAVDVVRAVGPGGHFLGEAHTLARMGDFQRSGIMNRRGWDEWEAAGRPTPEAAALAEAERLLAEHEPDPLPEDVGVELDRIVRAYEVEAGLRDP